MKFKNLGVLLHTVPEAVNAGINEGHLIILACKRNGQSSNLDKLLCRTQDFVTALSECEIKECQKFHCVCSSGKRPAIIW